MGKKKNSKKIRKSSCKQSEKKNFAEITNSIEGQEDKIKEISQKVNQNDTHAKS